MQTALGQMTVYIRILLSVCVLAIAGCGQTKLSDLPTEYAQTIRDLGFQPVYPPREGFQVGDVYLRAIYKANPYDPLMNHSVLVGSIPEIVNLWNKFADSRLLFVDTAGNMPSELGRQLDFFTTTQKTVKPKRERMLQLAFPNVTARISKGIGGGLFKGLLSLAGAGTQTERVTISFPEVRFMRAPFNLDTNWENTLIPIVERIWPSKRKHIDALRKIRDFPGCENDNYNCMYTIVTTVYYVRAINYIFGDAASLAVSAGIVDYAGLGANKERTSIPLIQTPMVFIGKSEAEEFPDQVSTVITESVRKAIAELGSESAGIVAAQESQRVFQVQQTFSQPVAIAWEGFHFNLSDFCVPKGENQCVN